MPDLKISGLTALTAADTADLLEIVDVSDTSMAATGTNKKITAGQVLASGLPGSFSTLAASKASAGIVGTFTNGGANAGPLYIYSGVNVSYIAGEAGVNNAVALRPVANEVAVYAGGVQRLLVSATQVTSAGFIKGASTISVGNATPSASGSGITFPATVSASTDLNTLDDYDEYTAASAACTGAITTAAVWKLTKVGNKVTLTLPGQLTTATAANSWVFGTAMPAKYRPTAQSQFPCCLYDNGVTPNQPGMVLVSSAAGTITVYKDLATSANFTAAAGAGMPATAVSWTI